MTVMTPMTRTELDHLRCEMPHAPGEECNHQPGEPLFFHSRCHPAAGTTVKYDKGVLYISCHECDRPIAPVMVAS